MIKRKMQLFTLLLTMSLSCMIFGSTATAQRSDSPDSVIMPTTEGDVTITNGDEIIDAVSKGEITVESLQKSIQANRIPTDILMDLYEQLLDRETLSKTASAKDPAELNATEKTIQKDWAMLKPILDTLNKNRDFQKVLLNDINALSVLIERQKISVAEIKENIASETITIETAAKLYIILKIQIKPFLDRKTDAEIAQIDDSTNESQVASLRKMVNELMSELEKNAKIMKTATPLITPTRIKMLNDILERVESRVQGRVDGSSTALVTTSSRDLATTSSESYSKSDDLATLGLLAGASDSDIKKAIRQIQRTYHPDTFSAKGLVAPQSAVETLQIAQAAYDRLTGDPAVYQTSAAPLAIEDGSAATAPVMKINTDPSPTRSLAELSGPQKLIQLLESVKETIPISMEDLDDEDDIDWEDIDYSTTHSLDTNSKK